MMTRSDRMTYIEIILNNCIYLFCPLSIYLLYTIYNRNIDKETGDLAFEIAILSSLYFILRFGLPLHEKYPTMMYDIPLLLCYCKKRPKFALLVSLLIIAYQTAFLSFQPLLLILEYTLYFGLYYYQNKKKEWHVKDFLQAFIIIKSFFLALETFLVINPIGTYQANIISLFILIIILYFIAYLVLSFFQKGEKIVELNNDLYNIEKEKELRSSLFKVTHEIKNPIAVCKGYLDMLDIHNEKKLKKYIPIVKEEINRTLILMDDFLDYTKIKIEKEELDLCFLLEEMEESLKSLFKEKNIVSRFCIPETEIYILGDYNRLKQVLINLLKNAVEAKDEQKSDSFLWVFTEEEKDTISIIIDDNGIGMDQETLSHISEMFFTTKKRGSGLGVGLSKEIIELHQGSLIYQSEKGKGTRVKLTLPKEENMT